ncbi:hypothetical protein D3C85_1196400 [compost metagenome]
MAFKLHRQLHAPGLQVFFQHHPHRRRSLQGNERFLEQGLPVDIVEFGQRRIQGHHRDESVDVQRCELQRRALGRLERHPQFHLAVTDHFQHLFVDHVIDRHVDIRIARAEGLEDRRQQVAGERRHRRQGHATALQGEALTQFILGIVPVGDQPARQRHQGFAFGGERHVTRVAGEQAPAQALLQRFDGQAQGRLRQVQALAGHGKAQALGHGQKGADLLDGHGATLRL